MRLGGRTGRGGGGDENVDPVSRVSSSKLCSKSGMSNLHVCTTCDTPQIDGLRERLVNKLKSTGRKRGSS